jgi:4-amino-4-deoxychorismate lyase
VDDQRRVAVWRNGAAVSVPAEEPVVTAFDQGLGRGDGVFESVAVLRRTTPHLQAHLERLARSAALLELADPGQPVWRALVDAVLADWPAEVEVHRQRAQGISVVSLGLGVPAGFRSHAPWLLGGAKTLSYAFNMAAQRHAHHLGADDVIFTSLEGQLLEGPTSTVVWAGGGALRTPPLETGILPGTTVARLFARAAAAGWRTEVSWGTVADLHTADAVWLVSGVRGAAPVHTLDGVRRGDSGLTGPIRDLLAL